MLSLIKFVTTYYFIIYIFLQYSELNKERKDESDIYILKNLKNNLVNVKFLCYAKIHPFFIVISKCIILFNIELYNSRGGQQIKFHSIKSVIFHQIETFIFTRSNYLRVFTRSKVLIMHWIQCQIIFHQIKSFINGSIQ